MSPKWNLRYFHLALSDMESPCMSPVDANGGHDTSSATLNRYILSYAGSMECNFMQSAHKHCGCVQEF